MTDEEFEEYLTKQGFPETYKVKLRELHKAHPNWVFIGSKTKNNWKDTLKNQNVSGRNLYQSTSSSSQGYLSTEEGDYDWYTDKFKAKEFSKAVDKAKWPSDLDYNKGADWWLKNNQKNYGYKYTATDTK